MGVLSGLLKIAGIVYFVGISAMTYKQFNVSKDKELRELLAGHIVADWIIILLLIVKLLTP